jgi:uncharacterized protein
VTTNTPQQSLRYGSKARRWNYFKDLMVERYGGVVYKVGVDAGFDCPNRDGTKAFGGCAYCSQQGSFSPHQDANQNIQEQIKKGSSFARRRYGAEKYIVYFQAFTNTYAPIEVLRQRYDSALGGENVVGFSIATRPDCINAENVALLKEYKDKLDFFTVELGLQSAFQNRLEWVNRQESVEDYVTAMALLREAGIPVITHVIFGFPGESDADMLQTVDIAIREQTTGIKLQMLHVIKGTKLGVMYGREPFELLTREHYMDLVIQSIERMPPQMEIHRITGETMESQLLAPDWVKQKTDFFRIFEDELVKRDTWQGKRAQTSTASSSPVREPSLAANHV